MQQSCMWPLLKVVHCLCTVYHNPNIIQSNDSKFIQATVTK